MPIAKSQPSRNILNEIKEGKLPKSPPLHKYTLIDDSWHPDDDGPRPGLFNKTYHLKDLIELFFDEGVLKHSGEFNREKCRSLHTLTLRVESRINNVLGDRDWFKSRRNDILSYIHITNIPLCIFYCVLDGMLMVGDKQIIEGEDVYIPYVRSDRIIAERFNRILFELNQMAYAGNIKEMESEFPFTYLCAKVSFNYHGIDLSKYKFNIPVINKGSY